MKNVLAEEQPLFGMCAEEGPSGGEQLFKLYSVHLTVMRQRATGAQWFLEHFAAVPSWNE
jgi:hypothetical protein